MQFLTNAIIAIVILFLSLQNKTDAANKPNIIFILTDDQGYGDLSCHGHPILKTPNIDRLYNQSTSFKNFYVSPTCAPTRSALLTGRHEFKNGITHTIFERERLTLNAITLPELLKTAGYSTGIFGKWHLGDEDAYMPNRRGFDEVFIHGGGGIGQTYPGSCGDAPKNDYFDPFVWHNDRFVKTTGYCTDVFFAEAVRWIDQKRLQQQPFYCHIATNAPHAPLKVRPEDEARYAKLSKTADQAKFFGMITNIDDNIGKLIEQLEKWKMLDDTLIIFMNDNGGTISTPIYNAGLRGQKGSPWCGGIRATSIWKMPRQKAKVEMAQLAAHIDFTPTLCDLAQVKLNEIASQQIEGKSLLPLLLKQDKVDWPDRKLFTHVGRWPVGTKPEAWKYANCSVLTSQWHLVNVEKDYRKNWQLFDLQNDPGEKSNIAAKHQDIVQQLDKAYDEWWSSVQPMLVNENAVGPKTNPFHDRFYKQFGEPKK